jgi:hypothetical protein
VSKVLHTATLIRRTRAFNWMDACEMVKWPRHFRRERRRCGATLRAETKRDG